MDQRLLRWTGKKTKPAESGGRRLRHRALGFRGDRLDPVRNRVVLYIAVYNYV